MSDTCIVKKKDATRRCLRHRQILELTDFLSFHDLRNAVIWGKGEANSREEEKIIPKSTLTDPLNFLYVSAVDKCCMLSRWQH
jgi:hypothetical protein